MVRPERHRTCARVLPVSAAGDVLLVRWWDAARQQGSWGPLGGTVEAGESLRGAARRELHEETGMVVREEDLLGSVGRQEIDYVWEGRRLVQDQTFFAVAVPGGATDVGMTTKAAWWSPEALEADGGAADDHLPTLMRVAVSVARGAVPRVTARVMPVDEAGRVLLLRRPRPGDPGREMWGSIGGEVAAGETLTAAALRELAEETGIAARPQDLTGVVHRGAHRHERDGVVHHRHSTVYALPVGAAGSVVVSLAGLQPDEVGNVRGAAWWSPEDMARAGAGTHDDLPEIMTTAVAAVAARGRSEQDRGET